MPISVELPFESPRHKSIASALRERVRASQKSLQTRTKQWRQSEDLMVAYIPESDQDATRRGKRESGEPQYTTIQLPYSYAIAMTAFSYFSTVFLARSPVFQFEGTTGEGEDQVLALEALAQYQMIKARMLPNLYIWLQDVPKYGEAWISPYWKTVTTRTSEVVQVEEMYLGILPTGRMKKQKKITEVIGYQGNSLYNIHPAKVFTDPRYPRNRFQEGEFVCLEIMVNTNQILEGKAEGRYINTDRLQYKGLGEFNYGEFSTTDAESTGLPRPETGEIHGDGSPNEQKFSSGSMPAYEFIISLVPSNWGLGAGLMPEKWVFCCDKDFRVIFECRPLGCLHDKFPLAQIEIEPEGYGMFSRSLIEVFNPLQNTLDWLINSHLFNVRQTLNNQWLLDPSKVDIRTLQGPNPGKAIMLKPQAYGTDIRTALMQLPVSDVTRAHFQDIEFMFGFGERLGISEAAQGVANPSSRRTAQEIRGDQTFSTSKLKTMAEYFSCTGWADLADMLIQNSQQYYDSPMKLKIAGSAAQYAGPAFLDVTPENIVGQFNFVPVDGTMPIDRYAQANMWRETIAQMAQVPQVLEQYDLGKIFGYMAQLGGLKNLDRFKLQVMPDPMMMAQAQAGNAVPAMGDPNALMAGQVPMNGPTA